MEIESLKSNDLGTYQKSAAQESISCCIQPDAEEVRESVEEKWNPNIPEDQNIGLNGTQLKKAVNDLNRQMRDSEAVFGIHDKTNRVTIKIIDKATKEVLKEYPPEQTLNMIAKVWEIAGILVDEKR